MAHQSPTSPICSIEDPELRWHTEGLTSEKINTIDPSRRPGLEMVFHITNPAHGGKVTCHKCGGFMLEPDGVGYWDHQHRDEFPDVWFHKGCYNPYDHYYGLDKPID